MDFLSEIRPTFETEKHANHPVINYLHCDVRIYDPTEFGGRYRQIHLCSLKIWWPPHMA